MPITMASPYVPAQPFTGLGHGWSAFNADLRRVRQRETIGAREERFATGCLPLPLPGASGRG